MLESENNMNNLEVKHVSFLDADLVAAKDENGTIWAGVRWMCDGMGLTRNQRDNQIEKIKSDSVLSKGAGNLKLPTAGGDQAVWCLKLDFVPLWLAKINITPAMKADTPELAANLETYQIKAKDVLAAAFLPQQQMQLSDSELMAKALLVAQKTIEAREARISELSEQNTALLAENEQQRQTIADFEPVRQYVDVILESTGVMATTQIAADYGLSAKALNRILHEAGVQHKVNGQWLLYKKYMGLGYTKSKTINITHSDGRPDTKMQTYWTQKGRLIIHNILTARGIQAVMDREKEA